MPWQRWFWRILLVVSLTFGLTCLYVIRPGCQPSGPADAIVVLGAAVWPGEQPSPALARRIQRGIELWHAGLAPALAPTGGVGANPPAEAEVMARVAREAGVPPGALALDPYARSTAESAERIWTLAQVHGWRRIIIVSEPYHLRRASILFRDLGLEIETACAPWGQQRWSNVYQTLREAGGLLVMIIGLRTL